MPGRGKGPSRLSVRDLWFGIFGFPTFAGFLLGVPLMGTPEGGEWARFWVVLVIGGFLAVWATVPNVVYLSELSRRRVWVPPGTARHPILLAIALTVLLLAAGVAIDFVGIWLTELAFGLAMPAWLIGALNRWSGRHTLRLLRPDRTAVGSKAASIGGQRRRRTRSPGRAPTRRSLIEPGESGRGRWPGL
jgi:hypothetical protein